MSYVEEGTANQARHRATVAIAVLVVACVALVGHVGAARAWPLKPIDLGLGTFAGKLVFVSDRDGSDDIYVTDGYNKKPSQITFGEEGQWNVSPTISGDGNKVAFACGTKICSVNADGSSLVDVSQGEGGFGDPSLSPDGSRIVSVRFAEIYVINADGSGQTKLTDKKYFQASSPVFSPDGSKIAFECDLPGYNGDSDGDLCTIDADGSNPRYVTYTEDQRESDPAFSPDGTKIAYRGWPPGAGPDIFVTSADGSGQPGMVTNNPAGETHPTFSADGTKLAFERSGDIYVASANGKGLALNITSALKDSNEYEPSWQPPAPPAPPPAQQVADTPPLITRLAFVRRGGKKASGVVRTTTAVRRKKAMRLAISYRLSESAAVGFTVKRKAKGRRRATTLGSFVVQGNEGMNLAAIPRKFLRRFKRFRGAARYRLTAQARDAAQNLSAVRAARVRIR